MSSWGEGEREKFLVLLVEIAEDNGALLRWQAVGFTVDLKQQRQMGWLQASAPYRLSAPICRPCNSTRY